MVSFALHLQGSVVVVGPSWLLASCRARQLQPPLRYQPRARRVDADRQSQEHQPQQGYLMNTDSDDTIESSERKTARHPPQHRRSQDNIFKGAFFAFVRPTPPNWSFDWNVADISATVTRLGGTIINSSIVNALRKVAGSATADFQSSSALPENALQSEKVCYLVSSGGYPQHQNAAFQPLIGEVMKEKLCRVDLVTPLWIQACVAERRYLPFCSHPYIFQPQSYNLSRLPSTIHIRVAVSGFVGCERTGIRILLEAIGATYTDNMSRSNTHLITKTNAGTKYQKAVEWGLKIVTLKWLKHIIQYGYCGENGKCQNVGCEDYFSFRDTTSCGLKLSKAEDPGHQGLEKYSSQTIEQVGRGALPTPAETTGQGSVPGSYASKMSQASAVSSRSGKDTKEQTHCERYGDAKSLTPFKSGSLTTLESPAAMQDLVDRGEYQINNAFESNEKLERDTSTTNYSTDEMGSTQSCNNDSLPNGSKAGTDASSDAGRISRKRRSGSIEIIEGGSETLLPMKPELDSKLLQPRSMVPEEGKKIAQDSSESQVLWYDDFTQKGNES